MVYLVNIATSKLLNILTVSLLDLLPVLKRCLSWTKSSPPVTSESLILSFGICRCANFTRHS